MKAKLNWMRLDNAALIYPAIRKKNWMAMFRLCAELEEDIDVSVLKEALSSTLKRIPSYGYRMRSGFFWFFLEQIEREPIIQTDVANPCVSMDSKTNGGYLFRVRYYKKRVALEVFHVLSDGSGGMCFFKTLLAEYLRIKYNDEIPRDDDILDCGSSPRTGETEDAFLKFSRDFATPRGERSAYSLRGEREPHSIIHITTGIADTSALINKAKEKKVSMTSYLTAVLIMAMQKKQLSENIPQKRRKPIKINVPVNLRSYYNTETKRNFSQYVNPGINSQLGEYSFDETLQQVQSFLLLELNEKNLNSRFSKNVMDQSNGLLRIMPLFIKNIGLRIAYSQVGDRLTTSSVSNLGICSLPPQMESRITRFEFILGPLMRNPVVLAALSYKGKIYLNFTRTIQESIIEREFFTFLVKEGVHIKIESNNEMLNINRLSEVNL